MKAAKPSPVSTAPGYDNQPMFSPDGARILFAANRDGKRSTSTSSIACGAAGWTEVFDAAAHALGAVSRLAVSPKGDAVAIVVAELKKQAFRSSRPESGTHR